MARELHCVLQRLDVKDCFHRMMTSQMDASSMSWAGKLTASRSSTRRWCTRVGACCQRVLLSASTRGTPLAASGLVQNSSAARPHSTEAPGARFVCVDYIGAASSRREQSHTQSLALEGPRTAATRRRHPDLGSPCGKAMMRRLVATSYGFKHTVSRAGSLPRYAGSFELGASDAPSREHNEAESKLLTLSCLKQFFLNESDQVGGRR